MKTDIGIDLGTGYTRIFMGKSIALSQPSVVTVDDFSGEATAFGDEAYKTIGRTSDRFKTVCPVEFGNIANFEAAQLMINEYVKRVCGKRIIRPRAIATIPCGTTTVQQRSLIDALETAGCRNVCLLEAPIATAINLGVDFNTPKGTTVVDIGKGTTDIAVLSMGGLAKGESIKIGSGSLDDAIIRFVRREHNISIGELTAEAIKKRIGCLKQRPVEIAMTVSGLNLYSGLPESFEITTTELYEVMTEAANDIIKAIQNVFEHTAPEMIADTSVDGIILTGGGALIHGMVEMLTERLGVKVNLVADPTNCVIKGAGKALSDFRMLRNSNYHFRNLDEVKID